MEHHLSHLLDPLHLCVSRAAIDLGKCQYRFHSAANRLRNSFEIIDFFIALISHRIFEGCRVGGRLRLSENRFLIAGCHQTNLNGRSLGWREAENPYFVAAGNLPAML